MAGSLPFVLVCACGASRTAQPVSATSATAILRAPAPVLAPAAPRASEVAAERADAPDGERAEPARCVLVCGGAVTAHLQHVDHQIHVDEAENADAVFDGMHDDLLACYRARLAESPTAHAFLVVDLVVSPDGSVRRIDVSGGALLGKRSLDCMTSRIRRASFAPVRGGGTLHVQIPLSFSMAGPDDST